MDSKQKIIKKEDILRTNCFVCNGPVTIIADSVRILRLHCKKCHEATFIVENKFGVYIILLQEEYNKKEKDGLLFE